MVDETVRDGRKNRTDMHVDATTISYSYSNSNRNELLPGCLLVTSNGPWLSSFLQ